MNTAKLHALQIVTGTTGGWQHAETVSEVRPSCLNIWRLKEQLRGIRLEETRVVNGYSIYRVNRPHSEARYVVNGDGKRRNYEQTLALISEKTEAQA